MCMRVTCRKCQPRWHCSKFRIRGLGPWACGPRDGPWWTPAGSGHLRSQEVLPLQLPGVSCSLNSYICVTGRIANVPPPILTTVLVFGGLRGLGLLGGATSRLGAHHPLSRRVSPEPAVVSPVPRGPGGGGFPLSAWRCSPVTSVVRAPASQAGSVDGGVGGGGNATPGRLAPAAQLVLGKRRPPPDAPPLVSLLRLQGSLIGGPCRLSCLCAIGVLLGKFCLVLLLGAQV